MALSEKYIEWRNRDMNDDGEDKKPLNRHDSGNILLINKSMNESGDQWAIKIRDVDSDFFHSW